MPKSATAKKVFSPRRGLPWPERSASPSHPLVKWRAERGYNQEDFIRALRKYLPPNRRGSVSKSTLSRLESGKGPNRPDLELLRAIVKCTEGAVPLDKLLPT